ncbi:helix-turn-helix DNA binding domain protein [Arthrobacter phage Janeemi]|uniref:Helix-turn-helix DNA binding domain protein n=1 Tax=Arthrobacter phage Janeemi TaxID=2927240 RepID=A0A9E7QIX7_9CAUD|nr:helix-turn-helix DNA binding domain protein [Arthrobacter phage Janeemi]
MPRKPVDRAEFARLHTEGWTIARLADHFGVSPRTVSNLRRELDLRSPRLLSPERLARIEAMLDDGWSFKEIHRTEGADMETLRKHFPGRQWSKAEAIAHTAAARYFGEQIEKAAYALPAKNARKKYLRESSLVA